MDITLRSKDVELSEDLKDFAQKKLGSLSKFFDHAIEIRVELEKTTSHHKQGSIFQAAVEMDVPNQLLVAKATSEEIKDAINKVKKEMEQKIKHYKGQFDAKKRETAKEIRKMKES